MNDALLRRYETFECGEDSYPILWHRGILLGEDGPFVLSADLRERRDQHSIGIKDLIREQAGHRCQRCGHPYRVGEVGERGEWSPCDERCTHGGPVRLWYGGGEDEWMHEEIYVEAGHMVRNKVHTDAQWRILTVHHLDEDKANCRFWNLAALCQRCHLRMQRAVVMDRPWHFEHSTWFRPYAAGFYAWKYLQEDLSREEIETRMDELLALEHRFTQETLPL